MFEIDGFGIVLTRGDSLAFEIRLKGRVVPNGARAFFAVKEKPGDTASVMEKTLLVEDRDVKILIEPEDTEGLKAKAYRWGLRIEDSDGNVYTPIADELFVITEGIA